jgi:hypothetical protein
MLFRSRSIDVAFPFACFALQCWSSLTDRLLLLHLPCLDVMYPILLQCPMYCFSYYLSFWLCYGHKLCISVPLYRAQPFMHCNLCQVLMLLAVLWSINCAMYYVCCAPRVSALAGCYRKWYQSPGYSEHWIPLWEIQAITVILFVSNIFLGQLVRVVCTFTIIKHRLITYV